MATEAKRFSGAITKFQVGTATAALVAAAALGPAVVANADMMSAPAPLAPVSQLMEAPVFGGVDTLSQDLPWWWLVNDSTVDNGSVDEAALDPIFSFTPLGLIPVFLQPAFRALTANIDFNINLGVIVVHFGSYGTVTVSRAS